MSELNANKLGLTVGLFLALVHLVWSVFVAITPKGLETFVMWILALHHIIMPISIATFNLMNAVVLIILTFIIGYVFGWVLGSIWNWSAKK